jgi:hypothetical protein
VKNEMGGELIEHLGAKGSNAEDVSHRSCLPPLEISIRSRSLKAW